MKFVLHCSYIHNFSCFPPYTFSYLLLFTPILINSMYSHTSSILYPSHLSIIFNFLQPITTKNHNYLLISPICCGPPSGLTVGKTQPAMLDKKGQLIHNYRNFCVITWLHTINTFLQSFCPVQYLIYPPYQWTSGPLALTWPA